MESRSTLPGLFEKVIEREVETTYVSDQLPPQTEVNTIDVRELLSQLDVELEI